MQVEPVDRKRWEMRIEVANPNIEYLEIFHDRKRRDPALGMLTPLEQELRRAA